MCAVLGRVAGSGGLERLGKERGPFGPESDRPYQLAVGISILTDAEREPLQ